MKKAIRRALRIGAIAAGLFVLLLTVAALLILFDKPLVRRILESQIVKRTGIEVRIGALDYGFFPLRVTAEDVELKMGGAAPPAQASFARLSVAGDLRKALRGEASAVRLIEAEGIVIAADATTLFEIPMDLGDLRSRATEVLTGIERIMLRDVRLSAALPEDKSVRAAFDLAVTGKDGNGDFGCSLERGSIDFDDKRGKFRFRGGLAASGKIRLDPSLAIEAGLDLVSATIETPAAGKPFSDVTFGVSGRFEQATREFAASRLKLDVPGLFAFDGKARGKAASGSSVDAEGSVRMIDLEKLTAFAAPRLPPGIRSVRVRGAAEMSGTYGMTWPRPGPGDRIAVSLVFKDVKLEQVLSGVPVRSAVSGLLKIEGSPADPAFAANLQASLGGISRRGFSAGGADIHVAASGTRAAVVLPRFEVALRDLEYDPGEGRGIAFEKASFAGRARLDPVRRVLSIPAFEGRLSGLPPITGTAGAGLGLAPWAEARIASRGLDLPSIRTLAAPFLPPGFAAWDIGGAADVFLDARGPLSRLDGWTIAGRISLSQVRGNDPSFAIAGEGLAPEIAFEGAAGPSGAFSFSGNAAVASGESLFKSVYISWAAHPLKAAFKGRYGPGPGVMDGLSVRFSSPAIGEAEITGSARTGPRAELDLRVRAALRLGSLHSLSAQAGKDSADGMKIEGGLGADLIARAAGGALAIKGRLDFAGVSLEFPASGIGFSGIDARIPVHVEAGPAAPPASTGAFPEEGFLRIGGIRSPLTDLKSVAVTVRGGTNAYAVDPLSLELFGGRLEIGRTSIFIDPAGRTFRGEGALALRGLDISRFPVRVPGFHLTGTLEADFPRLDIGPRAVTASGRGEAGVFGGKVVLRNLSVADPFTPDRAIGLDVDLVDIDLKKLTDEIPFGEVTGIVRGGISGLVVSYGQPARFDFRIESVPRRGVGRTFSLKAVDNLTILSGGQNVAPGSSRFWMRFIRGFRYDRLGIVSSLRNDTFTVGGTIREGGVEYLVKKPALFGINVVNKMPGKAISFKEMMSRLKRVGRSGQ